MNARQLFERLGAAPVEAPPKPTTKPPVERPGAPPRPSKHPNPYRRRLPNPGPMPKPKACEAKELFKSVPLVSAPLVRAKNLFQQPR